MTVTQIKTTKKGRFAVYLDGAYSLSLYPDIFYPSMLKEGACVTQEQLEALKKENELYGAKQRILNLLSYRSYSAEGLYQRLCEKTDEETAEKAVLHAISIGLVNDEDYAQRRAQILQEHGYSLREISRKLFLEGLDHDQIEEALQALEGDDVQTLIRSISKKNPEYILNDQKREKMIASYYRKGFSRRDILQAVESVAKENDLYEE